MLAISHPVNQINTAHAAGSAASQDVEAGHAAPAQRSPLPRQAPPAGLPARPGQRRASEVIRMLKCAVATLGVLGGALMSGAGVLANASTSNADGQYDPTPIAGAAGAKVIGLGLATLAIVEGVGIFWQAAARRRVALENATPSVTPTCNTRREFV